MMKFLHCLLPLLALLQSSLAAEETVKPAPADLKALLQEGLYQEEAAHQLDKAAENYDKLLATYDAQRQLAATALFRLAEVRRKQDRKEEAVKLYVRFLSEFPNHDPLARLSRENLAALGAADAAPAAGATVENEDDKEIRDLEKLAKESPDLLWKEPNADVRATRLEIAAGKGKLKLVEYLVKKGADLKKTLALQYAASSGHKAVCELLIAKGADINGSDALLEAVSKGHASVAEFLLEKGADPNLGKWGGPLASAISRGLNDLTQHLVEKGADVNRVGNVYTQKGDPIFPVGGSGTPLHLALCKKNLTMANFLLDHKADVNAAVENTGLTPLHFACALGDVPLCKRLLDAGVEFKARTKRYDQKDGNETVTLQGDRTPLSFAVEHESIECTKLLLDAGAQFNDDQTAIFLGALKGSAFVELMLAFGVSPDWKKSEETSLLHISAQAADLKACELLVKAGCAVDDKNKWDRTPLAAAFYNMNIGDRRVASQQIIDLLISKGADPLRDLGGNSLGRMPFLADRMVGDQRKFTQKFLYPKLSAQIAVHLILPVGGTTWVLANGIAQIPPKSLASLLQEWNPEQYFLSATSPTGVRTDGLTFDLTKMTLIRKAADTQEYQRIPLDLLAPDAYPALQWGDILEPVLPNVADDASDLTLQQNNQQYLPNELGLALMRHTRMAVTVKMEGAPEQLTLSGNVTVFDPTKTEMPVVMMRGLFQSLGGLQPKFTGATLRVIRPGAATIVMVDGTKQADVPLKDGDTLEVTLAEQEPAAAKQNRQQLITLISPGLSFAHAVPSSRGPTLVQLIASAYPPNLERWKNGIEVTDWETALRETAFSNVRRPGCLPHPDFSKIRILRMEHPGLSDGKAEEIIVNLATVIDQCTEETSPETARAADVELLPGDIVELSVIKEKLSEPWAGFDAKTALFLRKAMTYQANVRFGGKVLSLPYEYSPPGFIMTPAGMAIYNQQKTKWFEPTVEALANQLGSGGEISANRLHPSMPSEPKEAGCFLRDHDSLEIDFKIQPAPQTTLGAPGGAPRRRVVLPPNEPPPSPPSISSPLPQ